MAKSQKPIAKSAKPVANQSRAKKPARKQPCPAGQFSRKFPVNALDCNNLAGALKTGLKVSAEQLKTPESDCADCEAPTAVDNVRAAVEIRKGGL